MTKFTKLLIAFCFIWLLTGMGISPFGHLYAQTNSFTAGACIGTATGNQSRLYFPLVEDFNGDNYDDIIVVDEGSAVRIYINDGIGGFDAGTQIISGANYGRMSAGDLDGDGDLDFAHTNGKAYLNDGTGTFTQYGSGPIFTGTGTLGSTMIADFNGDNKQDVFFCNQTNTAGNNNQVWLNTGATGNPAFTLQDSWDNSAIGYMGLTTVGDIDGDNDIDIITNGVSSSSAGVYKNDGTGDFSYAQTINDYCRMVFLIDWDGDNDLDCLIWDSYNNWGVRLRKNDGTGAFETTSTLLVSLGASTTGVCITDIDNNNTPDVVVGYWVSDAKYYLNSGCSFTQAAQTLGTNSSNGLSLGDFNNDGKPDVFTAAYNAMSCTFINDLNVGGSPSYKFTGNGSWNVPSNWDCNTTLPPSTIPSGYSVKINGSGTTNLNIDQTLAAGSSMTIEANKTLKIASGNTLTNNGTITNNGTLKGTGTLVQNGIFTNSATGVIAPGASPGKLTVTGDFDLGSGTYLCEINGTGQGTTYDWLAVSGQVTLTNAKLVVDWGAFTPSAGDVFTLMTFGSRGGTFFQGANITIPAVAGLSFTTSHTTTEVTISVALLPVELTDFRASLTDENSTFLFWKTESETNNEGFEIERSADGRDWQKIGFMAGHGSTTEAQSYSFTDVKPMSGNNYYRLRQMDFDGASEFSKTVSVFMENANAKPRIFPTMTDGLVHLENNGEEVEEISVFSASGKQLMAAEHAAQLDLSFLEAGMYLVRIKSGTNIFIEKIIKH